MIKGEKDSEGGRAVATRRREPGAPIDNLSKSIIERLQVDGRRPFASIADDLGVSAELVEQRVQQLTDAGVIQITAVSDPLQLGFARQAMLGIITDGPQHTAAVAKALAAFPSVVYVVVTAGGFDLLVEVVGESDAHLLELVTSTVRPVPGVASIHTFLYLELEKQTFTWGTR